jgi:hypothetical protein
VPRPYSDVQVELLQAVQCLSPRPETSEGTWPDGPANQGVLLSSTILNDHWGELAIDLTLDLSVHLFGHRSFMQGKPFAPISASQELQGVPVGAWSITVRITPRLRYTFTEINLQMTEQVKLYQRRPILARIEACKDPSISIMHSTTA